MLQKCTSSRYNFNRHFFLIEYTCNVTSDVVYFLICLYIVNMLTFVIIQLSRFSSMLLVFLVFQHHDGNLSSRTIVSSMYVPVTNSDFRLVWGNLSEVRNLDHAIYMHVSYMLINQANLTPGESGLE